MDHALKPVVESINRSMSSHVMLNANKMSSDEFNNAQIINKYNEIKQKFTMFFQKAIELEDELREHK